MIGLRTSAVVVGVLALAACSSPAPSDAQGGEAGFLALAQQYLDESRTDGTSDAQLAELEQAVKDGGVSYETARQSMENTIQCMADGGVAASYEENETFPGIMVPGFSASGDEAIADACTNRESGAIMVLYVAQPRVQDAQGAHFAKVRSAIVACIEDHGGRTIDDKATQDEVMRASSDLADQTASGGGQGVNCLIEAGY